MRLFSCDLGLCRTFVRRRYPNRPFCILYDSLSQLVDKDIDKLKNAPKGVFAIIQNR